MAKKKIVKDLSGVIVRLPGGDLGRIPFNGEILVGDMASLRIDDANPGMFSTEDLNPERHRAGQDCVSDGANPTLNGEVQGGDRGSSPVAYSLVRQQRYLMCRQDELLEAAIGRNGDSILSVLKDLKEVRARISALEEAIAALAVETPPRISLWRRIVDYVVPKPEEAEWTK